MLGHLGINVPDLDVAKAYYDQLMPLLGYEPFLSAADEFAYLPGAGKRGTVVFFYRAEEPAGYTRRRTGLQHLAFTVPTRGDVHRVHEHVVSVRGEVVHAPRAYPEYPPPYYAVFWLDPHRFMLEAVCHHDRD